MSNYDEIIGKWKDLESCLKNNLFYAVSAPVKEFFANDIDEPIHEIAKKVLSRRNYLFESDEEYQEYLRLNEISIDLHGKIAAIIKQHYDKFSEEDREQHFSRTVHSYYHICAENILHAYVRGCYFKTAKEHWKYPDVFLYDVFCWQKCIEPFFRCHGRNFLKCLDPSKILYRIRGDLGIVCDGKYEDKDIRKPPIGADGRVNLAGNPVLYLAESLTACVDEVFKDENKKPPCILVGKFKSKKPLTIIDIEELIKALPNPSRWIDPWLTTNSPISASSEQELCEMYLHIFMQEYNNLFHISASGAERITYLRSTSNAKFLVDAYKQLLGTEIHGLAWNSGRSGETTKSYAFFNGDAAEFEVDEPYIAKLSETGNYEPQK